MTQDVFYGLFGFIGGLYIVMRRRQLVQSMMESQPLWKPFGKKYTSNKVDWIIGMAITTLVGTMSVIAGSLMLYSAATGHDWPLHHARMERPLAILSVPAVIVQVILKET